MFFSIKKITVFVLIFSVFLATSSFCFASTFEEHDYQSQHVEHDSENLISQECSGIEQVLSINVVLSSVKVKPINAYSNTSPAPYFIGREKPLLKISYPAELIIPPPKKEMLASIFKKE